MQIVSEANESVLMMLRRFAFRGECARWSRYCVLADIADGVLAFNLLTRELILLDRTEYDRFTTVDYLYDHFFVVSENTNEKELADFIKLAFTIRGKKTNEITNYTIFTTTDCNARCFYCFEHGRSRINMSSVTAEKAVQYIKKYCGKKKVSIGWFGGEPLYNIKAIDQIAEGLMREGVEFSSHMVSNGYLFDEVIVQRAVKTWHLKKVQISLDGTEKVYNKVKSYIYENTNPFEIVMGNITRLLDADICVSVRMNIDTYNAEDLLLLAEELGQRFSGCPGLSVYAHHLFKNDVPNAELYSDEEWEKRTFSMDRLRESLEKNGLLLRKGIDKRIRSHHCMADSGSAVTILPDGNIGLCEHHTESEFIGHLDSDVFDVAIIESWKQRTREIPECTECFYYPDCIKLEKCASNRICFKYFRQERYKITQRAMLQEYDNWKVKIKNLAGID